MMNRMNSFYLPWPRKLCFREQKIGGGRGQATSEVDAMMFVGKERLDNGVGRNTPGNAGDKTTMRERENKTYLQTAPVGNTTIMFLMQESWWTSQGSKIKE